MASTSSLIFCVIFFWQSLNLFYSAQSYSNISTLNWTASVSNSPIVSPPLLIKSYSNRLILTTFDGSVTVIDTALGRQESPWPIHFTEKAFYTGPLLYDIDRDGSMEILLTSSDGEILFVNQNGTGLPSKTISLPLLLIKRNWNRVQLSTLLNKDTQSDTSQISNTLFVSEQDFEKKYDSDLAKVYLPVETHILSTPVIGDFNGDGINGELIIPVNYYFEEELKNDLGMLKKLSLIDESEVDWYLANSLIVVDLQTKEIIFNVTLELTMKSSDFPSYLLSSPVVVDLDGENGNPEVIIGSMSGKVHVYNKDGPYVWNFELSDPIHGEIAVGDINSDGKLEVIAVDGSGNVFCYDNQKVMWEATVSGTMTAGPQLVDINNDDTLEVVIATNDGYLWALDGQTGHVSPNWPIKIGEQINSKVLFRKHSDKSIDIVVLADQHMHIFDMLSHTRTVIPITTSSYVPVIFDSQHSALIISTTDGKVLSFTNPHKTYFTTNKQVGVKFAAETQSSNTITTSTYVVRFEIYDNSTANKANFYNVTTHFPTDNGIGYHTNLYKEPGFYSQTLQAPHYPKRSYVTLEFCNRFKECSRDVAHFVFYPKIKENLVLFVMLPFLVMVSLLLILHGYPEGDLLPMWSKSNSD